LTAETHIRIGGRRSEIKDSTRREAIMNTDQIAALTIRRLTEDDRAAVLRLAQLDSNRTPEGELLGAEVEGRLLAAISLSTGEAVLDPFRRTQEIRGLLELRLAQLRRRERRAQRRVFGLPVRGRRSRAAMPGSPPGAGGRLLTLQPRAYYAPSSETRGGPW
jgi:hypothetical protein